MYIMRKAKTILLLGIWIAILPYLGFPSLWKNILFALTGLVLIYQSFVLYQNQKRGGAGQSFDNFRENLEFYRVQVSEKEILPEDESQENK